jgi:hypothetical protein
MKFINFLKLLTLLFILACSKADPVNNEGEVIDPNPKNRARAYADKGGGIFGDINNVKKSGSNTYDFATSNIMWRATLKTLNFLPLSNADYSGGVIIYDWYADNLNSKEQIKISVRFLNNELRSDSIDITAHKRICETLDRCVVSKLNNNFSNDIKDNILSAARSLKIEETKKEKK